MRFVLVSFVIMGWAFYELSGGADFEPRRQAPEVQTAKGAEVRLVAGNDVVVPDPVKVAAVIDTPEVARIQTVQAEKQPAADAAASEPSLAYRFNHSGADAGGADIQLASLADGGAAFTGAPRLDPATGEQPLASAPADAEPEALDIREVTGSRVNLRQGPGTTYAVVELLFFDDQVEVIEDPGTGWVQLRKIGSDRIGWMAARFVGKPAN